jgi:hypothetical protein
MTEIPSGVVQECLWMWQQLTRADIERVRNQLAAKRAEIVKRYEEELNRLDIDQAELERLARAISHFVDKFMISAPAERRRRQMGRGAVNANRSSSHSGGHRLWTYRRMTGPDRIMVLPQRRRREPALVGEALVFSRAIEKILAEQLARHTFGKIADKLAWHGAGIGQP